jgi:hypothetical protein
LKKRQVSAVALSHIIPRSSLMEHKVDTVAGIRIPDTTLATHVQPAPVLTGVAASYGRRIGPVRPIRREDGLHGGRHRRTGGVLILVGGGGWSLRRWLTRGDLPTAVSDRSHVGVHWAARGGLALLLIGHGGFGAFEDKPYPYKFFELFGVGRVAVESANLLVAFGVFEILLGLAVLPCLMWSSRMRAAPAWEGRREVSCHASHVTRRCRGRRRSIVGDRGPGQEQE